MGVGQQATMSVSNSELPMCHLVKSRQPLLPLIKAGVAQAPRMSPWHLLPSQESSRLSTRSQMSITLLKNIPEKSKLTMIFAHKQSPATPCSSNSSALHGPDGPVAFSVHPSPPTPLNRGGMKMDVCRVERKI